jgi:hypothetical protein
MILALLSFILGLMIGTWLKQRVVITQEIKRDRDPADWWKREDNEEDV